MNRKAGAGSGFLISHAVMGHIFSVTLNITLLRDGETDMDLIEISDKRKMRREEAAQLLRDLADSLSRHNAVDFTQEGVKVHVKVPDDVTVELELEIESGESSIEVEISW
jgi:amphi-Trp domain-containing protein